MADIVAHARTRRRCAVLVLQRVSMHGAPDHICQGLRARHRHSGMVYRCVTVKNFTTPGWCGVAGSMRGTGSPRAGRARGGGAATRASRAAVRLRRELARAPSARRDGRTRAECSLGDTRGGRSLVRARDPRTRGPLHVPAHLPTGSRHVATRVTSSGRRVGAASRAPCAGVCRVAAGTRGPVLSARWCARAPITPSHGGAQA